MDSEIVAHFLRTVAVDDVMSHLAHVAAFDRYQASSGIASAAEFVANTAHAIGLEDVKVERYPADGAVHWWSFRAPMSWTPIVARLEISVADIPVLDIDHSVQPFSIATYSAATPTDGVVARVVDIRPPFRHQNLVGALAIVGTEIVRPEVVDQLIAWGVIGFLTDAPSRGVAPEPEYAGRIELPQGSPIFAFSATPSQIATARAAAARGAIARVRIEVDRSEGMPVVSGVLPGEEFGDEVWLTAHLCHPRPGANDNASGVAALLGVAAAHVASRRNAALKRPRRPIRFVWGPEFLGIAAFLHQRSPLGRTGLPRMVINLDMVGEDQSQCGSPFVVERSPDLRCSLLNPIAEHVVGEVFAQTSSYGGTWRPMPFAGSSDHALFADPDIGCAAIQFCHAPDRFNHSAADTLDKVSIGEMRRSTVAASALTSILGETHSLPPQFDRMIRSWCARELRATRVIAGAHRQLEGGEWSLGLLRHVRQKTADMLELLDGAARDQNLRIEPGAASDYAVERTWAGPFNTRAMLADVSRSMHSRIAEAIARDKANLALLFNFAIRVDGRKSRRQIVEETSFDVRRPIDEGLADLLFGALVESGRVIQVARKNAVQASDKVVKPNEQTARSSRVP